MEAERKKLMAAALAEFSDLGIDRSSLDSIARCAELSPSIARALFVDKERLLTAVLGEATTSLVDAIGMAVERTEDTRELVRTSLRLLDQWLLDNPRYVRLLQWCLLERADSLHQLYQRSFYPSEFYDRIEQDVAGGQIRAPDAFMALLMLDSLMLFSHFMRTAVETLYPEASPEDLFEQRLEAIMALLERGMV